MKRENRILGLAGILLSALLFYAQASETEAHPKESPTLVPCDSVRGNLLPVAVKNSMPCSFKNTRDNVITREEELYPLFAKLCCDTLPVRIVHIGDSHVRGHVFSVAARHELEEVFGDDAVYPDKISYKTEATAHETGKPGLIYHAIGINGATTAAFTDSAQLKAIAALKPDLLILSFGTNESQSRRYDADEHAVQMETLLSLLQQYCPGSLIMLTTPPGCYVRVSRRKRGVNTVTTRVTKSILTLADKHKLPVWDLFDIAGGPQSACSNWKGGGYFQRDQLHYTTEGYRLHGELMAQAILKAYNHYVEH